MLTDIFFISEWYNARTSISIAAFLYLFSWECPLLKFRLLSIPFLQNSLVIDTPRVRKQTRPFSATKDELAELSEGESDNDETKPKLRRNYDRLNSYGRTECFRVEKNLLVYGWAHSSNLSY